MIRNVQGVEANQTAYIEVGGKYRFKVEKVDIDGYDQQGDEIPKLTFSCNKIAMKDGKLALDESIVYTHLESYSGDEKMLWKSKILQDAMKAPEVFDFNDLIGRYLLVDVTMREYNGKNYSQMQKLDYSVANDALGAIPNPKQAQQQAQQMPVDEVPVIDIDEDSIPF